MNLRELCTDTVVFPVGYIACGCKRVYHSPVEFSLGYWIPASWTIWTAEAASSGSGLNPDLPAPPVWYKPESEQLLLSSLHIISLSCSGINWPPASPSAPMCASRSVCVHSSQSGCFPHVFGPLLLLLLREWTLKSHFTIITVVIMLILTVSFV